LPSPWHTLIAQFHATARTDGIRAVGFDIDRTLPLPVTLPLARQPRTGRTATTPVRRLAGAKRAFPIPLPTPLVSLLRSTRLYAHVRYRHVVIPASWGIPASAAPLDQPKSLPPAAQVVSTAAAVNGKGWRDAPATPPPVPVLEDDGHVVGIVSGEPEADRSWSTVSSFGLQHVVRWGSGDRGGLSLRAGVTADGEFVYGMRLF